MTDIERITLSADNYRASLGLMEVPSELVVALHLNKITRLNLLLKHLLCIINPVTAYHRHGKKIPESKLFALDEAQIDVEHELSRLMPSGL
jgi:hypothetical protein